MRSRREFIKLGIGAAASLGTLLSPLWLRELEVAREASRRRDAPGVAAAVTLAPGSQELPKPLGPVKGPDGRPLVYDLDIGRIQAVNGQTATLQTGTGPRLLRLGPDTKVWFEGRTEPYAAGSIQIGDLVNASGTTLQDMSLLTTLLTVNPMPNLLGVAYRVSGPAIEIFPRSGKQSGAFQSTPISIQLTSATQFFKGRGNFDNPNATIADLKPGGAIQIDGYFTRSGERYALKVFFFNQLPPDDAPEWLLQKVAGG